MRDAVRAGGLATVHDIGDGGLAVALAECCIEGGLGARVEAGGRPVGRWRQRCSARAPAACSWPARARRSRPCRAPRAIGEVGGDELVIGQALSIPVGRLRDRYEGAIPALFA